MKKRNAFTLVELLAVIAILAVVIVLVTMATLHILGNTKEAMFRNNVRMVFEAIELELAQDPNRMYVGNVKELRLKNDVFISGTWSYHEEDGKIMLYGVKTKEFQIVGDLSSHRKGDNFPIEKNDQETWPDIVYPNLIDNIYQNIKQSNEKCIKLNNQTYQDCYFQGENAKHNIFLSGRLWKVIGINPNGTLKLMTADADSIVQFNEQTNENVKEVSNDFATSHINEWLNTTFYNSLNKEVQGLIEPSNWDLSYYDDKHVLHETDHTVNANVGLVSLAEIQRASTKTCISYTPTYVQNNRCYDDNALINKTAFTYTLTPSRDESASMLQVYLP